MQVYSLICWGGRTGKTVTLTIASPCVVTSTNHGLRDGTGLVFSTTGALPTGIVAGTTYYAKSTAANTFNLYTDAALTNIVNTSGTQSGTHTAKSALMLDYFAQYPGRWGDVDAERCYDSIVSWHSARAGAGVSSLDSEVCELGQAFVDIRSDATTPTIKIAPANIEITSKIDGVRTEACHYGVIGAGYELYRSASGYTCLTVNSPNCLVDGFSITAFSGYYGTYGIHLNGWGSGAKNMLVMPGTDTTTTTGIRLYTALNYAINCLVTGCLRGMNFNNYQPSLLVANNIVTKCATGMYPSAANAVGRYFNNISVGNTTNWGTMTAPSAASGNAGESGDTVWDTVGGTSVVMDTDDFVDWTNNDFRPALYTSPQVDSGVEYYGALNYDIADAERPNYNNGGAEAFDVGCYEFDHGYGDHPASTTVTFSGVHAGSEIRVYDASGNELAGVESCTTNPALTWALSTGDVRVVVVHLAYKIKDFQYTPVAGAVSLPVQQEADSWYSNP